MTTQDEPTAMQPAQHLVDRVRQTPPPVADMIGFQPVRIGNGEAVFELKADMRRHANPMGTLHGGILCDVADAAMGMAFASTLAEDETFTTVELKITFMKPVWDGTLLASARIVKRGRTLGFLECDVTDAEGSLVARVSSTCMALRGSQAEGR